MIPVITAALQVVYEAKRPPSTSWVDNIVTVRSIASYKHIGAPNTWLAACTATVTEIGCPSCPSPCLHTAHLDTQSSTGKRIRPWTQKAFALFFWKCWRRWCLSSLCLLPCLSALNIHSQPGHCKVIVGGYSAHVSFCSASSSSPIRNGFVK